MSSARTAQLALGGIGLLVIAGIALLFNVITQPTAPEAVLAPTVAASTTQNAPTESSAIPTPPSSSPAASPFGFAPTTPAEEAAVEAARVMTTWDPAKDVDETASEGRAMKLMTPERAKQVIVSDRGTSDPQWTDAAAEGWTSEPIVTLVPSDEPNVIRVNAAWEWVSPTGEREPGNTWRSFAFEMTDEKTPRISDYTWSNLG